MQPPQQVEHCLKGSKPEGCSRKGRDSVCSRCSRGGPTRLGRLHDPRSSSDTAPCLRPRGDLRALQEGSCRRCNRGPVPESEVGSSWPNVPPNWQATRAAHHFQAQPGQRRSPGGNQGTDVCLDCLHATGRRLSTPQGGDSAQALLRHAQGLMHRLWTSPGWLE